jgi:hypothetical protein
MAANARHIVPSIAVLFASCSSSSWEKYPLPSEVKVDSVIGSSENSGFREGCAAAVFRLTQDMADKIKSQGASYFPKYTGGDAHGGRHETPGEIDLHLNGHGAKVTFFGLYAIGGCDNQHRPELHTREIERALQRPGSYYRSGGNLEEIIVVVPSDRLVGHYYFG